LVVEEVVVAGVVLVELVGVEGRTTFGTVVALASVADGSAGN
jgi:hypothetical protein